jgi:hypothetical protein
MTSRIAEFWRTRWLSSRIQRQDILDALLRESLAYPVTHGARVVLPDCAAEDLPLFPPEEERRETTGLIVRVPGLKPTTDAAAASNESDASQSVETTYTDSDLALAFARL